MYGDSYGSRLSRMYYEFEDQDRQVISLYLADGRNSCSNTAPCR